MNEQPNRLDRPILGDGAVQAAVCGEVENTF
jgi:hypothetical protein